MASRTVSIPVAGGGQFSAYLAEPEGAPSGAIILLQEIFGVNANMRWTADRFAAQGLCVLVPDLFWRIVPDLQLDPTDAAQRARAMELNAAFDAALGLEDCVAAAEWLKQATDRPKVGALGYCLGGRLAFLLAAGNRIDAAAAFYPVAIHADLGAMEPGSVPLLVHLAGDDALCNAAAQDAISAFLDRWPGADSEVHAGLGHGFARMGRTGPADTAAQAAERRTVQFFGQHLK